MAKNRLLPYHSAMPGAMRFLLCFLLLTSLAFSRQKHVTVNGAGLHDGNSIENAWTLNEANSNAMAGDTIWVHAGAVAYNDSICPQSPGSAGSPIIYQTWDTETVTLNPSTNAAIQIRGNHHIWVRGRFWADHARQALYAYNSHDIIIDGLRADSSSTAATVEFDKCSYVYIYNCSFHKHEEYDDWPDWQLHPVTGDSHKGGETFQLKNCQFCYMEADTFMGASHYNALPTGPDCHMIYFTHCLFSTGHGLAGMNHGGNSVYWDNCTFKHQFAQGRAGSHLQIYGDTSAVRFCTFVQDTTSKIRDLDSVGPLISYFAEDSSSYCTYSRFYNNTVVNYRPTNPLDTNQMHSLGLTDNIYKQVRHLIFKNNVFLHPNRNRETAWFKSDTLSRAQFDDTVSNNWFWRGAAGADSMLRIESHEAGQDSQKFYTMSEARQAQAVPGIWLANNQEADPKLTGATDPRPTGASPMINAAIALTYATNTNNSASLPVNDPCYFFPGWTDGIIPIQGDSIKVNSQIRRITAISGNTLTLDQTANWSQNAPVYLYQSRHWVGSAPDVGALERPAYAVDTCLMGTTVSSGQVGTMTVARADANYFLVAIGIVSSSVQVDSCYVTGSSPVLGTRVLRQTQGSSPGLAVELWEIRTPSVGPQSVRVKLASNTEFTWGLVTVNGVDERVSPVSAIAQKNGAYLGIVNQAIGGNGTVLWATLQNTVTPGSGVTVIGTKSDLSGSRIFTMMKKPNGGGTTFSYMQSPTGPLAAGGAAIGIVLLPPDPGE